jgi:ABC-type transport system substrate-binding protein
LKRLALATWLAAAAVAHAETRPKYGGAVVGALVGAPGTLDPVRAMSHSEITLVGLVFDTLYQAQPDGSVQLHLAAAPPVFDTKGTAVHIALRKGVRFHDGSEVTATDVAKSLERARSGARWLLAGVSSVKADGDGVDLELSAPMPELALYLAQPQTAVTKGGKAPGAKPIGSGPYVLASLDRGKSEVALRAFDDHFLGRPYLDQLTLRWYDTPEGEANKFESGEAQLSARGVAAFAHAKPVYESAAIEGLPTLMTFIGFGRAHPAVTGSIEFRRAIDLALSRDALATVSSGERVTPTRLPMPGVTGTAKLDPTAAKVMLDKLAALASKPRLELLIDASRPDDRELAERIAFQLDQVGVVAAIVAESAPRMRERVAAGQCDLWIGQLVEPIASSTLWWASAFAAGEDEWPIAQLVAGALDPAAAAKAFDARLPILPLAIRSIKLSYRTDVHGVAFDGIGRPCFADLFLHGAPVKVRP